MQRITNENVDQINASMALQQGVLMELPETETVSGFARRVLKLDDEGFRREVQTLILNNRVVDDPDATRLSPGDTLVLSGAMPGLVGAMLRSGSPIMALRSGISGRAGEDTRGEGEPLVRVKFFNTILKNHRADILACGFLVEENPP